MRRFYILTFLSALLLFQGACISKLWKKEKNPTQKVYDVYGTVQSLDNEQIVVQLKGGKNATFILGPASIKGSDFGPGAYVHVYYKTQDEGDVITMVVEKIG